jgi:hypothetical protein
MDRDVQMDNPCSAWLSATSWDNITELDKLTNFHDLVTSFEQYPRDWRDWYTSPQPETAILPGRDRIRIMIMIIMIMIMIMNNFHDLVTSFEQYPRDWRDWYTH